MHPLFAILIFTLLLITSQAESKQQLYMEDLSRQQLLPFTKRTGALEKRCHNKVTDLSYRCIKGDFDGVGFVLYLPPYPVNIPSRQTRQAMWDDRFIEIVPQHEVGNAETILRLWDKQIHLHQLVNCQNDVCDGLVLSSIPEHTSEMENHEPSHFPKFTKNAKVISVCTVYLLGSKRSLPLDCVPLAIRDAERTWFQVLRGEFPVGGLDLSPEVALSIRMESGRNSPQKILSILSDTLTADDLRFDVRLLNKQSLIANRIMQPSQLFMATWERCSIRFDIESEDTSTTVSWTIKLEHSKQNTERSEYWNPASDAEERSYKTRILKHLRAGIAKICVASAQWDGQVLICSSRHR